MPQADAASPAEPSEGPCRFQALDDRGTEAFGISFGHVPSKYT